MGTRKKWLCLLLLLPFALGVKANKDDIGKVEGILHGYVTDAVTKKPISGVTVLAKVPGSGNSKDVKEVTTDADGYFTFAQLPAATVTIQFDKKGYQPYKRPNVTVKEKTAVKLNVEFLPEEDGSDPDDSEYPILKMLEAE